MCGRIARERGDIEAEFGVTAIGEAPAAGRWLGRYNIAPPQLDVHIRPADDGRALVASSWGLIPRWAKDRAIAAKTFNARGESLLERASFKGLVARHRCIIPVSGYYEWQACGKTKTPLYIHHGDGKPLALAGLWTEWTEPRSGERLTSHTIITCDANAALAGVHARMPVVLTGEGLDAWLDPGIDRPADVLPFLAPGPDDLLADDEVAPLVNNVRNDGPELIAPVGR